MSSPSEPFPTMSETESSKRTQHAEIAGLRIPLPRWAVTCLGLFAVVAAGSPAVNFVLPRIQSWGAATVRKQTVFDEYQRHFSETPKIQPVFDSSELGMLTVQFYGSDGCLLVLRRDPGSNQPITPTWIPRKPPTPDQQNGPPSTDVSMAQPSLDARLLASAQLPPGLLAMPFGSASAVQGNCKNPHPGEFRSWNGEQKGCWLAVWRAWNDGCQHYQWFNTCNGSWDSEPNGAPKLHWKNCNH